MADANPPCKGAPPVHSVRTAAGKTKMQRPEDYVCDESCGEWTERRSGESGSKAYHPFEVKVIHRPGEKSPTILFPAGVPRPPDEKTHGSPRAFQEIYEKRANALRLLEKRKPWCGDPTRETPPENSLYAWFDERGDARFYVNPALWTHEIKDGDRYPLVEGWANAIPLLDKNGRPNPWPADRMVVAVRVNPVGARKKGDHVTLEVGKGKDISLEGARWRVNERRIEEQHGKIDLASLRCIVSTYVEGVPFFVGTSKMGCASWNLPAGPDVVEVDFGKGLERVPFGGACPSAAGLNLFERIKELSPEEQEAFMLARVVAGQRIVALAQDLDADAALRAKGVETNATEYHDEAKDAHGKITSGFICTWCYALKGNYRNVNQQFYQAMRLRWAEAALEAPAPGVSFTKGMRPKERAEKSFFTWFMTTAIDRYYAPEKWEERAVYAEDARFFRIHDSGDLFSLPYTWAWIEVARRLSHVKFWAPTRMWMFPPFLRAFEAAPANFAIRPSALHFRDDAPVIPGMAGGSTAAPSQLAKHWNCPAMRHDRSSCIGALPFGDKAAFREHLPQDEHACRVCWGGFPSMGRAQQAEIAQIPVTYNQH
jgi:hypothetical protein